VTLRESVKSSIRHGLTIEIHDAWLARPEDLRKILTTLAGLECPPIGAGAGPRPASAPAREDLEESLDPEEGCHYHRNRNSGRLNRLSSQTLERS
jgi:hypothetical protein